MARALAERAGLNDGSMGRSVADHWPSPVHKRRSRRKKQQQNRQSRQQQLPHPSQATGGGNGLSPPTSRSVPSLQQQPSSEVAAPPQPDRFGLYHSTMDVGARVKVYSYRYDEFYAATLVAYDHRRGMHCCQYDDGDKQWLDLTRKKIELMSPSSNARPVVDARSSSSAPNGQHHQHQHQHQHQFQRLPAKQPTNSMPYIGNVVYAAGGNGGSGLELGDDDQDGGASVPSLDFSRPSSRGGGGSRPGSAGTSRGTSRPGSRSGSRGMSRGDAAELLRASPFLEDPASIVRPSSRGHSRGAGTRRSGGSSGEQ